MVIASIISGIDSVVKESIESLGTRSIYISKFDAGLHLRLSREERMRKALTHDDATFISKLPSVEMAVPLLDISNHFGQLKAGGRTSTRVQVQGTLPAYEQAELEVIWQGRFFNQFENSTRQEVCVIGSRVAETFFPFGSALDKNIQIGGRYFRVIGVLNKREQLMGGGSADTGNIVFIPFSVALKLRPDTEDLSILAIARPGLMEEAQDQISDSLRLRRHVPLQQPNDFGMSTSDSLIANFRSITSAIAISMVAISSLGLLVGGIGVMNVMLVSVTERTKEIGVRKAIGARRLDILWQFLIEAMTLTGAGGLIGLIAGWVTTLLIKLFIPSYVPLWAPASGLIVSIGIGLIFGLWPAWKAARLDPIRALHHE